MLSISATKSLSHLPFSANIKPLTRLVSKSVLASLLTPLFYFRGDTLVKEGEPVDFLGIFVQGAAFVTVGGKNVKKVGLGEMTGHMFASDLNLNETHTTTLVAASDGVLAVVPLGELKIESRR